MKSFSTLALVLNILYALNTPIEGFGILKNTGLLKKIRAKVSPSLGAVVTSPPQATPNANDLFFSDSWQPIRKDLDKVPVFTCANEQGYPLAYTIDIKDNTFQVPFFYTDITDAQAELEKVQANTKDEGLKLIAFPLGTAFQMWATDEAVIVPNKEAIMQAGAPPDTNPIGQQIPLFACMDVTQENEDGTGMLPLFMVLEEANAAVAEAVEADGGNPDDFEVVSLSLNRAVELLANVPGTPSFQFVPPASSVKFIENVRP